MHVFSGLRGNTLIDASLRVRGITLTDAWLRVGDTLIDASLRVGQHTY